MTVGKRTRNRYEFITRQRSAVIFLLRAPRFNGYRARDHRKRAVFGNDLVTMRYVRARRTVDNDKVQHVGYASRLGDGRDILIRVERKRMPWKKTAFVIRIFFASQRRAVVYLFITARSYLKRALCDRERTA